MFMLVLLKLINLRNDLNMYNQKTRNTADILIIIEKNK